MQRIFVLALLCVVLTNLNSCINEAKNQTQKPLDSLQNPAADTSFLHGFTKVKILLTAKTTDQNYSGVINSSEILQWEGNIARAVFSQNSTTDDFDGSHEVNRSISTSFFCRFITEGIDTINYYSSNYTFGKAKYKGGSDFTIYLQENIGITSMPIVSSGNDSLVYSVTGEDLKSRILDLKVLNSNTNSNTNYDVTMDKIDWSSNPLPVLSIKFYK